MVLMLIQAGILINLLHTRLLFYTVRTPPLMNTINRKSLWKTCHTLVPVHKSFLELIDCLQLELKKPII